MGAAICDMRVGWRYTQIQTCTQAQTQVYGEGDKALRWDAVCAHATISMVAYKQRHWQFRLGGYMASADGSSRLKIGGGSR